jgi:lysophospholipase
MLKYAEFTWEMVRQGWGVILWDHRGQGWSGRNAPNPQVGHVEDFAKYVQDMEQVIREVVLPNREGPLVLVAHSMGGCIGSLFLAQADRALTGLFAGAVFCSPMHRFHAGPIIGEWAAHALATAGHLIGSDKAFIFGSGPWEHRKFEGNPFTHSVVRHARAEAAWEEDPRVQVGGPSFGWVRAAVHAQENALHLAPRIHTPLLLLQAGSDPVVDSEAQVEFCQRVLSGGGGVRAGDDPRGVARAADRGRRVAPPGAEATLRVPRALERRDSDTLKHCTFVQ